MQQVLVDSETGVEAEPVLVDRASGRLVDGTDFVFSAGPAASKPFRDRYEGRPRPTDPARRSRESRTARISERVRAIPRGSVRTYSEIDPEAPRVVGRVLTTTHEKVPWHRVVRADGSAPVLASCARGTPYPCWRPGRPRSRYPNRGAPLEASQERWGTGRRSSSGKVVGEQQRRPRTPARSSASGPHVLRPSSPHSGSIHAFLRAVRHAGVESAPLPVHRHGRT